MTGWQRIPRRVLDLHSVRCWAVLQRDRYVLWTFHVSLLKHCGSPMLCEAGLSKKQCH